VSSVLLNELVFVTEVWILNEQRAAQPLKLKLAGFLETHPALFVVPGSIPFQSSL
jgi:hypothetical protein